jgi:hypothetical protein
MLPELVMARVTWPGWHWPELISWCRDSLLAVALIKVRVPEQLKFDAE